MEVEVEVMKVEVMKVEEVWSACTRFGCASLAITSPATSTSRAVSTSASASASVSASAAAAATASRSCIVLEPGDAHMSRQLAPAVGVTVGVGARVGVWGEGEGYG